jgi:hypothetical protein
VNVDFVTIVEMSSPLEDVTVIGGIPFIQIND